MENIVHPDYHGKLCKCAYCEILKESKLKGNHNFNCGCRMCQIERKSKMKYQEEKVNKKR